MKLLYQGADIYNQVSVNTCIYDSYGEQRPDALRIVFNDGNNVWDNWGPSKGDTIQVILGACNTGKMYINEVKPENGKMSLRATSVPQGHNEAYSKSWEYIHFKQICNEVASRHNLRCEFHGVEDQIYKYVKQQNKEDFIFLEERCVLEGCAFLVYDGKLVVYSESNLESKEPIGNLLITNTAKFEYEDRSSDYYGKCNLKNGSLTGTYCVDDAGKTLTKVMDILIASQAEANRFAKNILRFENKKMTAAICDNDVFFPGYAAGSLINIKTPGVQSWNGKVFCSHVRHDLVKAKTKLFFRKPLEGY